MNNLRKIASQDKFNTVNIIFLIREAESLAITR